MWPFSKKASRYGTKKDDEEFSNDNIVIPFQSRRLPSEAILGMPKLLESFGPFNNPDAGTEFDDRFFKRLGEVSDTDVPIELLQNAQRLSILLFRKNVRAYTAINTIVDFALGDGIEMRANDDRVAALLQKHWEVNQWDKRAPERLRSLALFGEQLYPAFIGENGIVKISSISPFKIRNIERDKENAEEFIAAHISLSAASHGVILTNEELKAFPLIRPDNDGQLIGESGWAFYFAINRMSGSTRGSPDLLSAIDWLEVHDNFLFTVLERALFAQTVVHDLKLEGANREEIRNAIKDFISTLHAGGVYGHNEKAELNIKTPNLGASDVEGISKLIVRQIQAGTRMPGLFYGDSDDLTRAAASELAQPVAKTIQARQKFFKEMLADIFNFQIMIARKMGLLEGVTDFTFEVVMPPVFLRDLTTISSSLQQTANALEIATGFGWATEEEARNTFRLLLQQFGPLLRTEGREKEGEVEKMPPFMGAVERNRVKANGAPDRAGTRQ